MYREDCLLRGREQPTQIVVVLSEADEEALGVSDGRAVLVDVW